MAALESTTRLISFRRKFILLFTFTTMWWLFVCLYVSEFLQPWIPTATSVRWRTRKPNIQVCRQRDIRYNIVKTFFLIQRPIPDHYLKAQYKNALQPIYPDPLADRPWFEVCGNLLADEKSTEVCTGWVLKCNSVLTIRIFSWANIRNC